MDVSLLSKKYTVRKLNELDVVETYELCRKNTLYYQYCPPFVTKESIISDMDSLPPNKELNDKYYIGYYDRENLIAIMDLIMNFPDEMTAYIGLFMTDVDIQNKGIGSEIIEELCVYLKDIGMAKVRLGWVKGNSQAENFWHKNKFVEIGQLCEMDRYTVVIGERHLL